MKRFELVLKQGNMEVLVSFDKIDNDTSEQFMFLRVANKSIALLDKKRQQLTYKFQTVDTVFFTLTEKEVK